MSTLRALLLPTLLLLLSGPIFGQQRQTYPEGEEIPRSMTPLEEAWIAQNPLGGRAFLATPLHMRSPHEHAHVLLQRCDLHAPNTQTALTETHARRRTDPCFRVPAPLPAPPCSTSRTRAWNFR